MKLPSELTCSGAETAIVLGSGLAPLIESLPVEYSVKYSDIEGLPTTGVPGHEGRFILSYIGSVPVIIAVGRVHIYEGWSPAEVALHVEALHACGISKLLLTNAAGTLAPDFHPGTWMMISDHINLYGRSPLTGGPHFIDMSEVYSRRIARIFREAAQELGEKLHEGVYAMMHGPQFETPAEIRMLSVLGAHAVGMSTVPEATKARQLGMEVAGFSCLTNWAAGISQGPLSHEEVTESGRSAAHGLAVLFERAIPAI